ncbi:MAG: acylphosphatase, partial [Archaeoglobaceae archaeon]|nr:acylphosphatase [Archaeoglobaceae archaeon]MDW7990540.1 acylphosphatase [Archaeoglobaceae archaeon]
DAKNVKIDGKEALIVLVDGEKEQLDQFLDFVKTCKPEIAIVEEITVEEFKGRVRDVEKFRNSFNTAQLSKIVQVGVKMLEKMDLMLKKQDETIREIIRTREELGGEIREVKDGVKEVRDGVKEVKNGIKEVSSKLDRTNELLEKRFDRIEQEIERIKKALIKAGIEI